MNINDIKDIGEKKVLLSSIVRLNNNTDFQNLLTFLKDRNEKLSDLLRDADSDFRQTQGRAKELDSLVKMVGSARDKLIKLSQN
ncbi:hypothetical protein [Agarilytica rhodophyticola]|uniref:hypothetical protein n=1 Tax=Agarilytica rhodophyticola TaxID=1737490 RepID=UPI000B3433C7|nr:hypothetical protein [Agarilytica rhodophyticola]